MFIINEDATQREFSKKSWSTDYARYASIMSECDFLEKLGDDIDDFTVTINRNDVNLADEFSRRMNNAIEYAVAKEKAIAGYFEVRADMFASGMTPEEFDYGVVGNMIAEYIPMDKNVKNNADSFGYMPAIRKIVSNKPHTIVCFSDETSVKVTCADDDFDVEKGIYLAILKKAMGGTRLQQLFNLMRNYIPQSDNETDKDSVASNSANPTSKPELPQAEKTPRSKSRTSMEQCAVHPDMNSEKHKVDLTKKHKVDLTKKHKVDLTKEC